MTRPIILASGSEIRAKLLGNANVSFSTISARIDEVSIRAALLADENTPRDISDALAEAKARKVSSKMPDALVIGCDQILDFGGEIISKPATKEELIAQLQNMRGKKHFLYSAVVLYHNGGPIWRHIGQVRLTMREFSQSYIDDYVARNWDEIRHSAGGYMLEAEGIRLFSKVEGDYFSVLGLPMIELLSYLAQSGDLPT